jgi:hypothetical protein
MNLRRLIEKITFKSRERGREDFAAANDQHFSDYTDETTAARSQHGGWGAGGAPPGYVHDYDDGHPRK